MTTDDYPNGATIAQLLAWHERQHEASHAQLDAAKITGSMNVVLKHRIAELVKQRDEARAELAQLQAERDLAQQLGRDQQLTVRTEPSRLEIAAQLVAGRFSNTTYVTKVSGDWIKYALDGADALIAAAKEVTK